MDRSVDSRLPHSPACRCRHCHVRRAAVLRAVEELALGAGRRAALGLRDEVLDEMLSPAPRAYYTGV